MRKIGLRKAVRQKTRFIPKNEPDGADEMDIVLVPGIQPLADQPEIDDVFRVERETPADLSH